MSSIPNTNKCSNCGVQNPSSSHYCARCGKPLAGEYIVVDKAELDFLESDIERLSKEARELQNQIDKYPINRLKRWWSDSGKSYYGITVSIVVVAIIVLATIWGLSHVRNTDRASSYSDSSGKEFRTKTDSVAYLIGINFGAVIKGNGFGDIKWERVSKGITDYVNSKGSQKDAGFENQFEISPSLINVVINSYLSDRSKGITGSKARRDSVAYLLGLNFGAVLKNNHFGPLDNQIIKKGFNDYTSAKGNPKDTLAFLAQFRIDANLMKSVINEFLSERRSQIAQANLQKERVFLAENRSKPNVVELPSGLQYIVVKSGNTSKKPRKNSDTVHVKYKGMLLDGSVFDETPENDTGTQFQLSRVIKGWQEGLKKIGEGGEIRLYIPSSLAYGDKWDGIIEPNSLLVFDVQLLKVVYGR